MALPSVGREGQLLQQKLLDVLATAGVRVLGPNSMGVIIRSAGWTLSVNAVLEMSSLKPGRLGLISQSGTILGTLLSRGDARGIGFSRLLSVGNEADIGVGELIDTLVDDPETDAILLFLEAIRDAPKIAGGCAPCVCRRQTRHRLQIGTFAGWGCRCVIAFWCFGR